MKAGIEFFLKKLVYAAGILAGLFLAIEILLQLGIRTHVLPYYYPLDNAYYSFNAVPYFSKPCCIRDSISGYRLLDNGVRVIKICRGNITYDQVLKPNNAGFISPCSFEPRKTDSTVFRWLIFGDSFTAGSSVKNNWPMVTSQILKDRKLPVELHSFALSGSGITAWGSIFDWLNKMNYEYDGVIIACFGNDLSRDQFVTYQTRDYCYYGWSKLSGSTDTGGLNRERVMIGKEIEQDITGVLAGKYAPFCRQLLIPYYLRILYKETKQNFQLRFGLREIFDKYIFTGSGAKTDSLQMVHKYGQEKMAIIEKILTYCEEQNKKILLASVPDLKGSMLHRTGDDIQLNVELKWLAAQHNALFFDGYSIFDNQSASQYFLEYDGHWNQRGSNLFATQILPIIINDSRMQAK